MSYLTKCKSSKSLIKVFLFLTRLRDSFVVDVDHNVRMCESGEM